LIRAADTDVCAQTTEPLASNATIRTGAAKIDTDTLRAHFGMFDIVGLLILGVKPLPRYASAVAIVGPSRPIRRETGEPQMRGNPAK
jgi:hypothetical protein